ncbi:MAG TPA: hypothetical protein VMT52_05440 [Planctomycetota bacterium]|nr:hypothetical protein [Planctomycetota bacterium]
MLSNAEVIAQLNRNFVCGWTNIKGKTPYAGSSNTHLPTNPAMEVTNCAGHHNVQMFFLTSDGRVLHCLPGYWNPRHFLEELEVAVEAGKLYYRKDISAAERNREYLDLQLRHALSHTQALRHASAHQGFDKMDLEKRKDSDFHRKEGFITGLKTPDQVLHERLAERPFLPFEAFPVAAFIDMGLKRYKYDFGLAGIT